MQKALLLMVVCLLTLLYSLLAEEDFCYGTVIADNLNVRVQPSLTQTVVAKFAKGAVVKIFSISGDWYEVEVPPDANLWIAAKDISEDGEVLKESFLRSGPDITYSPYSRRANKGEKLEIIERRGHWVKVKVPMGVKAWVNKHFISIPDEDIKKLPVRAKIEDSVEKKSSPHFDFFDFPEKKLEYVGVVIRSDEVQNVKYAISNIVDGTTVILTHLYSEKIDLAKWEGKKVIVTGREKLLKNEKRTLLIVDEIKLLEESTH